MSNKVYISLCILIVLIVGIVAAQSYDSYWRFEKNANVGKPELVSYVHDTSGWIYNIYRVIDWQTGKVIYLSVNGSAGQSVSPTIAVTNLEHK